MFDKFLQGFIPQTTKEWTLLVCLVLAVITLIMFYKALMNCKTTIESYVNEQRNFKSYYSISSKFIDYCNNFEKGSVKNFLEDNDLSEIEFITSLKKYGDDNAGIL